MYKDHSLIALLLTYYISFLDEKSTFFINHIKSLYFTVNTS